MQGRLTRSRSERMIGGVAGGMGGYLGLDPTWVRIAWVVLALATSGGAVLVYLLLLVVIPEEDRTDAAAAPGTAPDGGVHETDAHMPEGARRRVAGPPIDSGQGALILGGILVAIGAWALVAQYVDIDWSRIWPIGLVVAGIVIIVAALSRRR